MENADQLYGLSGFWVALGRASAGASNTPGDGVSVTGCEFDGGLPIGTGCRIVAGRGATPFCIVAA